MEPNMSDALMGPFKSGDKEAFDAIFKMFYQQICKFSQKLTNSDADGEEIALDTFVKLWKRHYNFETLSNVKAFLFITARNACLNFLGNKKRQSISYRDLDSYSESWEQDHQRSFVETEILKELQAEVEKLPDMNRQVFKMLFYEGKKPAQVAEELGIARSTVDSHKSRALQILREIDWKKRFLVFILIFLQKFF